MIEITILQVLHPIGVEDSIISHEPDRCWNYFCVELFGVISSYLPLTNLLPVCTVKVNDGTLFCSIVPLPQFTFTAALLRS